MVLKCVSSHPSAELQTPNAIAGLTFPWRCNRGLELSQIQNGTLDFLSKNFLFFFGTSLFLCRTCISLNVINHPVFSFQVKYCLSSLPCHQLSHPACHQACKFSPETHLDSMYLSRAMAVPSTGIPLPRPLEPVSSESSSYQPFPSQHLEESFNTGTISCPFPAGNPLGIPHCL